MFEDVQFNQAQDSGQTPVMRSYLTNPSMQPVGDMVTESAQETPGSLPKPFSDHDQAEIELARKLAWARERKDRLNQAKADAQLPAIQKNIEDSRARADAVLGELRSAREQLTATQPPALVQGQMNMGELLAAGLGTILGGRADQILTEGMAGADKRNQLQSQNELSKYQVTRENVGQLVDFLQKQFAGEQGVQHQLQELGLRAEIDAQQTVQAQDFQSTEAEKQRTFQEREKAWTQFYTANTDGEVQAAGQRLRALDPENSPDDEAIGKAIASARTKREGAALDYWKATVGRLIEAYQGVVPDSIKGDLEQRAQAIAQQFDVDPKVFGEIPTEAFYKRQMETRVRDEIMSQWKDRFRWMTDKERNDHAEALAQIRIAQQRAAIAQQSANTSGARLEWDKLKGTTSSELKTWRTKLNTKTLELKGLSSQIAALDKKIPTARYVERKELNSKRQELELRRQGVQGQIDEINTHLQELDGLSSESTAASGGQNTYTTSSGAKVRF